MPDIENPPWTATPGDTWTAQSTGRTYRFAVVELERIEPETVEWGRRTPERSGCMRGGGRESRGARRPKPRAAGTDSKPNPTRQLAVPYHADVRLAAFHRGSQAPNLAYDRIALFRGSGYNFLTQTHLILVLRVLQRRKRSRSIDDSCFVDVGGVVVKAVHRAFLLYSILTLPYSRSIW